MRSPSLQMPSPSRGHRHFSSSGPRQFPRRQLHLPCCLSLISFSTPVYGRTPTFQHQHGGANPRFKALIQAQTNNIGWSQIFQGPRLVSNWAIKLDRRCWTGAIWARKLVPLLWLRAMRTQRDFRRNADRHGCTKAANHAIRHARLLTSITALHTDAHSC